jgi:hypothetical protein
MTAPKQFQFSMKFAAPFKMQIPIHTSSLGALRILTAAALLGIAAFHPRETNASVISSNDLAQSLSQGASMALNDQVRQTTFNIVGGSYSNLNGTATPLGPWYSGISRHYFDYILNTSGSTNFTISVATGATGQGSPLQQVAIASYVIHPTLDFVLLQHAQSILSASLPQFTSASLDDNINFVGYGDRYFFGSTNMINDGQPGAYDMQVINSANSLNFVLSSQFGFPIPGSPAFFDSSSPGYYQGGLALFMQTGTVNPTSGLGYGGALPFLQSGLAAYIQTNTPLNFPLLSITPDSNSIVLTWSATATGWRLQTSSNLTTWSNLVENLSGPGNFTDPIASHPQNDTASPARNVAGEVCGTKTSTAGR